MRQCSRYLLVVIALCFGGLAACGEDEPVEQVSCGDSTVLEDGQCVPQEFDTCEDGEVLTADGECVDPDEFACDDGTVFDFGAEECVPADGITCGEGTVEVDGQCVPDDPLSCGPDTVLFRGECMLQDVVCGDDTRFDADELQCNPGVGACEGKSLFDVGTGECVDPNVVECGEDTYESEDRCLPLESFADHLAEDADIDYSDATPIVTDPDEEFVFTGTMDSELSHTFEIDADEGQWLEITLYTRGLPSPGFELQEVNWSRWERRVSPGRVAVPTRTVLVPSDDVLELTVETSMGDYDDWGGQGHESWKYVGVIEVIDAPSAVDWDLDDPVAGQFDDTTDNWINVDVSDADDLILIANDLGADAENPTVDLWSDETTHEELEELESGERIEFDVSSMNEIYLHFDASEFHGTDTGYDVQAAVTTTLDQGDRYEVDVNVDAGQTLIISHESDQQEMLDVDIRHDGSQVHYLTNILPANLSDYSEHESRNTFYYARQSGTYTVEFVNNSFTQLTSFLGLVQVQDVPAFEVTDQPQTFEAEIPGSGWEGDWRFVVLDAPAPGVFDATIEASSSTARLSVYKGSDRQRIVNESGSSGTTTAQFEVPEADTYYLVARPWSSWTALGDLEFTVSGQAGDPFEPGDKIVETFSADVFDVIAGEISYVLGEDLMMRLYNEADELIIDEELTSTSSKLMELIPGTGDYTLEVENVGDDTILGVSVDTEVVTPFAHLSEDEDFSHTFDRGSIDAGEREYVLLQANYGYELDVDVDLGDGEEADVRMFRRDTRELAGEARIAESGLLSALIPNVTTVLVELEAVTDLANGYEMTVTGETTDVFIDELVFDPAVLIEPGDTATYSFSVPRCDQVTEVSVYVNVEDGWSGGKDIDLHTPAGTYRLRDGSGPMETTYPDETSPEDSFNSLYGQSGSGTWSLEVINGASFTDTYFGGWSLDLVCNND